MAAKNVLYVEDSATQRQALHNGLEMRGFNVDSAGTVAEAKRYFQQNGQNYNVVVLDMKLEGDPNHQGVTGAKLGIEFLATKPSRRPEFLILSAYKELDYYESAIELGAAAYLAKGLSNDLVVQAEVVRYVRVLALRNAINLEQTSMQRNLRRIVETSHNRFDALKKFCEEVLAPEFAACLGAPFFMLLRDEKLDFPDRLAFTVLCDGTVEKLPEGPESFYDTLQGLAHGDANRSEPFMFDKEKLPAPTNPHEELLMRKLNGAALLPLSITNDLRLAIGILPGGKDREDPKALARVLADYFRPAAIECMLNILSPLVGRNAKRRGRLLANADLTLFVGQEMNTQLKLGAEENFFRSDCRPFRVLTALAEDLKEAGEMLRGMNDRTEEEPSTLPNASVPSVASLILRAWDDLEAENLVDGVKLIPPTTDCATNVAEDELLLITVRLLQWLALRQENAKRAQPPIITVHCRQTGDMAEIVFEDASRRLAQPLRQRLFEPFSLTTPAPDDKDQLIGPGLYLALYLAKMLVEEKYGGQLLDCSDDLPGAEGHRFVMRLPAARQALSTAS